MRRLGEIRGQSCLHPEGQGVSGKGRLRMFAGCEGKGKYAVNPVYTPKGRAFQERIDLDLFFACFETTRITGARNERPVHPLVIRFIHSNFYLIESVDMAQNHTNKKRNNLLFGVLVFLCSFHKHRNTDRHLLAFSLLFYAHMSGM
jgi:hypothetical protein